MSKVSRTDFILDAALKMKQDYPAMSNDDIKKQSIKRWNEYYEAHKVPRINIDQKLQPISQELNNPSSLGIPTLIFGLSYNSTKSRDTEPTKKKISAYNNFVRMEVGRQKEYNKQNGIDILHTTVLASASGKWKTLSKEEQLTYK